MRINQPFSPSLIAVITAITASFLAAADDGLAALLATGDGAFGGDFLTRDGITGDWFGARSWLLDRGIKPYATLTGEFSANVEGGFSTGSAWTGLLDFGLEANLNPLFDWEGGTFFTNGFFFHGNDLSGDRVGDFNGTNNFYTDTEINVFNLFLRQTFPDGRGWIKAGQIAADDDFMIAESSLVFFNSEFGTPSFESGNIAAPIYPLAAPGAMIYLEPDEAFFFQGAVYAGDAGPNQPNNHGFKWRAGGGAGWAWFGEAGYHYAAWGEGVMKVGGYYASGEFTNFSTNATETGLGAVYALLDHRFLNGGDAPIGLTAFIRGGATPDESLATVAASITGGITADGVVFSDDVLGFGLSHTIFGEDYLNATRLGGTPVTSSETILEWVYQAPVTQWLAIQPDLQYIINPHFSNNDAVVLGIRAEWHF